ncbi:SDR family NAD(P)-dependent oxidoreductase, partial [Streptomyces neyagawaensis]
MTSPFDLTGKLAVVTGARRGIGRAMARALAEAGADIIGVSATLEDTGSDVEKDVLATGHTFEAVRTDFADPEAVRALGDHLATREPPVDILVNNAGTIRRAPAAHHPDTDWDLVLQVNL